MAPEALKIALLVPSRGRPNNLERLVDAVAETSARPDDIAIFVGLDLDDAHNYHRQRRVFYTVAGRMNLARWTDTLARSAWDDYDILASVGDDHVPRTDGWDELVCAAMEEIGSGLVYPNDGHKGESLPTAAFWSADVIKALGWFCPPPLAHMYVDNFWLELGQALGRCRYIPEVLFEHVHPAYGMAPTDDSYKESDSLIGPDGEAWLQYRQDTFDADVARVVSALQPA